MLIFPLKKEWYDKIKSGKKTVEYREFKPYWTKRIYAEFKKQFAKKCGEVFLSELLSEHHLLTLFVKALEGTSVVFDNPVLWDCKLRLGYTKEYLSAKITKIEVVDGKDTDLHIDKPVYAIHLINVKEMKEVV